MTVRPARIEELSRVFRMTHDLSSGVSVTRHVVTLKRNRKLRSGVQFILEDDNGEFLSTLTAWRFDFPPVARAVGLANLFTPECRRGRGYASRLLEGTLAHWEAAGRRVFYLVSEVGTLFYSRQGFRLLPRTFAEQDADEEPAAFPMLRCPPEEWPILSQHGPFLRGIRAFIE